MGEQLSKEKRTQAERRAETRALLLASASSLFGERGYDATSLEDIAEDCALTIRPIYYHFGNKRGLFMTLNGLLEQRALRALACSSSTDAWESLLGLCTDPAFRRVILEDAPNVLGRERWVEAAKLPWSGSLATDDNYPIAACGFPETMRDRAALATLMEAAMYVIERGSDLAARREAMRLISILLPNAIPDSAPRAQAQPIHPGRVGA